MCILFLLERFQQYLQNASDTVYERQKMKIMLQHGFSSMEEIWPTPFLAKLLITLWEQRTAEVNKIIEYTHCKKRREGIFFFFFFYVAL